MPEDLRRVLLIHFEAMDGWADWFEAAGVEAPVFPRGPIFPHYELVNTAAEQGLGIALSIDATVRGRLSEGRLVRLFDTTIKLPYLIHSVAFPEARRNDRMISEFSAWIHKKTADDGVSPDTYLSQGV